MSRRRRNAKQQKSNLNPPSSTSLTSSPASLPQFHPFGAFHLLPVVPPPTPPFFQTIDLSINNIIHILEFENICGEYVTYTLCQPVILDFTGSMLITSQQLQIHSRVDEQFLLPIKLCTHGIGLVTGLSLSETTSLTFKELFLTDSSLKLTNQPYTYGFASGIMGFYMCNSMTLAVSRHQVDALVEYAHRTVVSNASNMRSVS